MRINVRKTRRTLKKRSSNNFSIIADIRRTPTGGAHVRTKLLRRSVYFLKRYRRASVVLARMIKHFAKVSHLVKIGGLLKCNNDLPRH